jgi:ParB family chromosome partitioning protein
MKETIDIAIDQIKPNRYQPRKEFNADSLFELAQSIRENGLIQPIVVREQEDYYEIIAGERRYRAMILAGYTNVPCLVMNTDDNQVAQLALIENIQRENLSSIEEADAYQQILKSKKWTQERLAQTLGKSQSAIANKIRLLQLPEDIQLGVMNRKISERHARALLQVNQDMQLSIYQQIISKKLNVAQTEKLIDDVNILKTKKRKPKTKGVTKQVLIAKNTLLQAIAMIERSGIKVRKEEIDSDDEYSIIVHLKK